MKSIAGSSISLKLNVVTTLLAMLVLATAASAQNETPLFTYPNTISNDSGIVWPGLIMQGQDGELYSTIQTNGSNNAGSVYKMSTNGQYTLISSFCAEGGHCTVTGANPDGGVTLGTDGNYYGTAQNGGAYGFGTVFKMAPDGTLTTLWNFTEAHTIKNLKDEGYPWYPPVEGQDGNFYGVDSGGYVGDYGVFYKMTPKGALTPHPLNYSNGAAPNLPVQGRDGNFYGTTLVGGDATCKCGVVYKATTAGKITALHKFTGYPNDGNRPLGVLVQGADGNFYGTTYQGGTSNLGTIFKISPSGTYTLIRSFTGDPDGAEPESGLVPGSDGNFYGTTAVGGARNGGAIYQLTPAGKLTVLYSFCSKSGCADGLYPVTPIVQHTNGKFYGNTSGNSNGGSVFYSFDMGLPQFVHLALWSGKDGSTVEILGQGFTSASGVSFNGTAASFKVVSDTYLTATVPSGATSGNVYVTTSGGTLSSDHIFLVVPVIKTFNPTSGPVGTAVTISGSGFTGASKVKFGSKSATFTVDNDGQIATTVPTGAVTSKISVTTAGGIAKSKASFTVTP